MMWKFNALFCAALAGAAMLSAPARADTQADWFICENDYYNADAAIAACTSVIQSGTVTGADWAKPTAIAASTSTARASMARRSRISTRRSR